MGKNTLTFTVDLRDDLPAGGVGMIQKIILGWMENDTRQFRVGDIVCTVGDVAPVNPMPKDELIRLLPTYNTVGADLSGYNGNRDLWREDMDTIRAWYLKQMKGES